MKLNITMDKYSRYTPSYSHATDAGIDLRATRPYLIPAHKSALICTGLHVEIPEGYVGLVFPRSGLGSRGITLRNATGVIDSGYRGEIRVALWNTTDEPFDVEQLDRIAQLVILPYVHCDINVCDSLTSTDRGVDGFGSTGVA